MNAKGLFNNNFRSWNVVQQSNDSLIDKRLNARFMNNNSTHQEVLVITATGFATGQFSERDITGNKKNFSPNEKLMDACWNGLIMELLPEISQLCDSGKRLYLWQVREATRFIALEMSEYPIAVNKYLSIDPYRFMEVQEYS